MDAAVAALVGAAIGTFGTFGAAWLQQRHQTRRDLLKVAAELGKVDFEREYAQMQALGKGGSLPPLALFVSYHADVLNAIANGTFGADEIAAIDRRQIAQLKAVAAHHERVPVKTS